MNTTNSSIDLRLVAFCLLLVLGYGVMWHFVGLSFETPTEASLLEPPPATRAPPQPLSDARPRSAASPAPQGLALTDSFTNTLVWTRATPDSEPATYVYEQDESYFVVPGIWFVRDGELCTWQTESWPVRLVHDPPSGRGEREEQVSDVGNGFVNCVGIGRLDLANPESEFGSGSAPRYTFEETPRWSTPKAFGWEAAAAWGRELTNRDGDYLVWGEQPPPDTPYIVGPSRHQWRSTQRAGFSERSSADIEAACHERCRFCDGGDETQETRDGEHVELVGMRFNVTCDEDPVVEAILERWTGSSGCSIRGPWESTEVAWDAPTGLSWPPPAAVNAAACQTSDATLDGVGWSGWNGSPLARSDFRIPLPETTLVWARSSPEAEVTTHVFPPAGPPFAVPGLWFVFAGDLCEWQTRNVSVRLIAEGFGRTDEEFHFGVREGRVPNGYFRCRDAGLVDTARPQTENASTSHPAYGFRETPKWSTSAAFGWEVSASWYATRWRRDGQYLVWDAQVPSEAYAVFGSDGGGETLSQSARFGTAALSTLGEQCTANCTFCDGQESRQADVEDAVIGDGEAMFAAFEFAVQCDQAPELVAIFEREAFSRSTCSSREERQSARVAWEDPDFHDWPPPVEVNSAACATSDRPLDGVGWSTWLGDPLAPSDFAEQ